MKSKRQQEILRIIGEKDVETQDQLLSELKARGVQPTQATITRDIKELHLVKELTGYRLMDTHQDRTQALRSPSEHNGHLQRIRIFGLQDRRHRPLCDSREWRVLSFRA